VLDYLRLLTGDLPIPCLEVFRGKTMPSTSGIAVIDVVLLLHFCGSTVLFLGMCHTFMVYSPVFL
jgi:hypothetical protein